MSICLLAAGRMLLQLMVAIAKVLVWLILKMPAQNGSSIFIQDGAKQ